ncbi:hypothetical protein B296_00024148 [Ensete ventricosum]|uniref:Uncharacterized protein n=1 Tax=Ensete ventricosum TaxID=4639 RepID=A0A426YYP1_ENSVE|nr:hypothetical protein B296_00024148 [Ensete ventricosum]
MVSYCVVSVGLRRALSHGVSFPLDLLCGTSSMTSVALLGVDEYAEKSNERLACLHCLFFHARTGMKEVEDPQWIRSSLTSFD